MRRLRASVLVGAAVTLASCGAEHAKHAPALPPAAEPALAPPAAVHPAGRSVRVGALPEGIVADQKTGLVVVAVRNPTAARSARRPQRPRGSTSLDFGPAEAPGAGGSGRTSARPCGAGRQPARAEPPERAASLGQRRRASTRRRSGCVGGSSSATSSDKAFPSSRGHECSDGSRGLCSQAGSRRSDRIWQSSTSRTNSVTLIDAHTPAHQGPTRRGRGADARGRGSPRTAVRGGHSRRGSVHLRDATGSDRWRDSSFPARRTESRSTPGAADSGSP